MKGKGSFFILETERLLLRKLSLGDVEDMYDYGKDDEVSKFVMWKKYESIDDAKEFANFVISKYENGDNHFWAIEYKENNKMIGTINFVKLKEKYKRAEIGYVLNRDYWNKGIITEAMKRIIEHSFNVLNLNKVQASCIKENIGSYKAMEKVGMKYEGTSRQHMIKDGKYHDLVNYSILNEEFDQKVSRE